MMNDEKTYIANFVADVRARSRANFLSETHEQRAFLVRRDLREQYFAKTGGSGISSWLRVVESPFFFLEFSEARRLLFADGEVDGDWNKFMREFQFLDYNVGGRREGWFEGASIAICATATTFQGQWDHSGFKYCTDIFLRDFFRISRFPSPTHVDAFYEEVNQLFPFPLNTMHRMIMKSVFELSASDEVIVHALSFFPPGRNGQKHCFLSSAFNAVFAMGRVKIAGALLYHYHLPLSTRLLDSAEGSMFIKVKKAVNQVVSEKRETGCNDPAVWSSDALIDHFRTKMCEHCLPKLDFLMVDVLSFADEHAQRDMIRSLFSGLDPAKMIDWAGFSTLSLMNALVSAYKESTAAGKARLPFFREIVDSLEFRTNVECRLSSFVCV